MKAPLAGIALAGLALAASGCTSPCQELGDRICNCQPVGSARSACQVDVKNRLSAANPSSSQEDYCSSRLATCPDPGTSWNATSPPPECTLLNSCQGMVNCGLALPQLDGQCGGVAPLPLPDGGA